jgi:xylan 1,4-beta-xylosidase
MIDWEQIGNALTTSSQLAPFSSRPSRGIFAPTLRHHDGVFWLVTTNVDDTRGHLIVTAEDPAGPWSDPVHTVGVTGIDPDLTWDADGTCYLTWAFGLTSGGIVQARVNPRTGELFDAPYQLWAGTGLAYPEGPHLYRVDGWWYLLIAEGGTERGHCISVARSRTITGPYEGAPTNPILSHRSTTALVQNTGHGDLVIGPDGRWAMVYLGARPRGVTPRFHVIGREVFLAGVSWVDGWPVVDETVYSPPQAATSFSDTFDADALHPRWVSAGRLPDSFVTPHPNGGLKLSAAHTGPADPPFLGVRVRDLEWTARAQMDAAAGTGRMVVRIDDAHWYALEVADDAIRAIARAGPLETVLASAPCPDRADIEVVISCIGERPGSANDGPDRIELAVSAGSHDQVLASLDGRYLSTEVAGGYTGRVVGVQPCEGSLRLARFSYEADSL